MTDILRVHTDDAEALLRYTCQTQHGLDIRYLKLPSNLIYDSRAKQ